MHPTWARDQRGISVGQNHNVYIMNAKETGARVHDFFMFYVQEGSTRVHTTTTTPDEGRFTVKSLKSSPWIQHLSHQENAQIRHSMVLRIWARSSICLQNSLVVMLMISLLQCCCMRLAWTSGPIKANGVIQPQTQKHFHHSMIWFENTLLKKPTNVGFIIPHMSICAIFISCQSTSWDGQLWSSKWPLGQPRTFLRPKSET